jgi:hypothetical protein
MMSESIEQINANPLSAKDINRILFERETSKAELARLASHALNREVTTWQLRAVIYRYEGVVYQDLREWLAGWLGVEVWQVGNEPSTARNCEDTEALAAA